MHAYKCTCLHTCFRSNLGLSYSEHVLSQWAMPQPCTAFCILLSVRCKQWTEQETEEEVSDLRTRENEILEWGLERWLWSESRAQDLQWTLVRNSQHLKSFQLKNAIGNEGLFLWQLSFCCGLNQLVEEAYRKKQMNILSYAHIIVVGECPSQAQWRGTFGSWVNSDVQLDMWVICGLERKAVLCHIWCLDHFHPCHFQAVLNIK